MCECETADCPGIAVAEVTCEMEGAYPYCADCTASLTSVGERIVRRFDLITDEMVERAADVIWDIANLDEEDQAESLRIMRQALVAALYETEARDG